MRRLIDIYRRGVEGGFFSLQEMHCKCLLLAGREGALFGHQYHDDVI
jgi:hypothetical protein